MQDEAQPPTDETTLARLARAGDPDALARLVLSLRIPLFAVAYAELGSYDDAQDAVAAALLRICRRVDSVRDPAQIRPWMQRIARNEARRLRGRGLRQSALPLDDVDEPRFVATSGEASVLRIDIDNALRRLPAEQARAIAYFYLDGLSVAEIAERLTRPVGTVKYYLHRGRAALSHELKGYAPMSQTNEWIASILSTDIAPSLVGEMTDALKAAGWDQVLHLGRGTSDDVVRRSRFVVMDEWIGGRSAFELFALLRPQCNNAIFCLLIAPQPADDDSTVMAAYSAGFDMLLTMPFDIAEFRSFAKHARDQYDRLLNVAK